MRSLLTAVALAFVGSCAVAEWPKTTYQVVSGIVDRYDGASLIVGSFHIPVRESTIIEGDPTAGPVPAAFAQGQRVTVTFRCPPNSVPGCVPERIRLH